MRARLGLCGAVVLFGLRSLTGSPLAQAPPDRALADLSSADPSIRLHAAGLLRDAGSPEAAIPLATLITDSRDEVQLAAIAAELNIFLAEKIVVRRHVGLVIEVRSAVLAEPIFSSGPLAIGAAPVPREVLAALRTACHDDNPRVGLEALYAFGVLAVSPGGALRRDLLQTSGPELVAFVGSPDVTARYAAVRVVGRVFAHRVSDGTIEPTVGDAMIAALNDRDSGVRRVAMDALGSMRYERAVQALTELYTYYAKGDTADAAFDAIAHIAHPSSRDLLIAGLTSKSAAVRLSAIEGLARLHATDTLNAIQAAASADRRDAFPLASAFAAAMIANAPMDAIGAALGRPRARDQAKAYLAELAPRRSAEVVRFLQDSDPRIRADVLDAIGAGGDPAAIPSVEPLLTDPDARVAMAAERALARLRQTAATPVSQP